MNCTQCKLRSCRDAVACGAEEDIHDYVRERYSSPEEKRLVQAAAALVDNGRAGMLSRLEEISEFAASLEYRWIGIAYCFAIEEEAGLVRNYLQTEGFSVSSVCCTLGGMEQRSINSDSTIKSVGCNPIFQAEQLNREKVDLVVTMGLCLGHDILLNRHLQIDSTNLIVKDRTTGHNPIEVIRALQK